MLKRDQIEEKYKWDLSKFFSNDEEWLLEFENIKPIYEHLKTFEGELINEDKLYRCLDMKTKLDERVERLYVYASLRVKEDGTNDFYQNLLNKLNKYLSDVSPSLAYIYSEINEFSDEMLKSLANNKKFENFDLLFKDAIKSKPHMLSKQEEKLLSKVSECIGGEEAVFNMFDTVDIKFDDVENQKGDKLPLNNANYYSYVSANDGKLRETAYKNLNRGYGKLNYTISTNYMNSVITNCTFAKIRKFNSAFEYSLFNEDIEQEVYDSLINCVNANLDCFHRYFKIKQKVLNLDNLFNYDINTKLTSKNMEKYTYEDAFNLVCSALSVLGDDYINQLNFAKNNRWIDVMPNENKETGAFECDCYLAHPVVMLNFDGTIDSVFALAHELGHMMHTFYSNKTLPSTKAGYEIFVAEVASTVNEVILARWLLNKATTKHEKLYYIDYLMNIFYQTIHRQTMFAEFEYKSHKAYEEGADITTDALNEMYLTLCKKYLGNSVNLAEEIKFEWLRMPHFYNAFYVYKYATGLISALSITDNILSKEESAVNNYKKFLSGGASKPPVELLKMAGVDLKDEKTFDKCYAFINKILDEFEALI